MFVLKCPHCQEHRDEEEFAFGGEAFIARPTEPDTLSDEQWGDYLFMRKNIKGWNWEMWSHAAGCRKFFVVKRHTVTHKIEGSWPMAEARRAFDADTGAR